MLRHVGFGTERPLFLPGPEGDADGAARLEVQRLENAHGLHQHGRTGGVVGRTGSIGPRVEVGAHHNDLVLELRVSAGNLRDDVRHVRVVVERVLHLEFERHRNVLLQNPCNPAVRPRR